MASKKHNHKYYYGLMIANQQHWACALQGCGHYMPNHMKNVVNNKASICWGCGDVTYIDLSRMDDYELGHVFCDDCIIANKTRRARTQAPAQPAQIESSLPTEPSAPNEPTAPEPTTPEEIKCKHCGFRPATNKYGLCGFCWAQMP